MSNRAQCWLGLATGVAIDAAFYAGIVAVAVAALAASGGVLWWRSR